MAVSVYTLTPAIILSTFLLYVHGYSIAGKQVIRQIFPDPLSTVHSNVKFGFGYNSITLTATGTSAINITEIARRTPSGDRGFISHTFKIKHFSSREDLKRAYGRNAEITVSEGYTGTYRGDFVKILTAQDVTLLDSVLVVDVDIVSDTECVKGQVMMEERGKEMLATGNFTRFVETFGTHYLRKKIYGGKIVLLLKISSRTVAAKEAIDTKLKMAAGSIGNDSDFRNKMAEIGKLGILEPVLYTLGGKPFTGNLKNLDEVIDYVLAFSLTVINQDQVRTLEFNALWNLVDIPREFGQHVFSLQRETDKIMGIYTKYIDIETKISDISLLRNHELSWISDEGYGTIQGVEICLEKCRRTLTRKFRGGSVVELQQVYEEFKNSSSELKSEIDAILREERRYESLHQTFLINPVHETYVSSENWEGYSTANTDHPIPLYLETTSPVADIKYSVNSRVYIKSPVYPGHVMCLAPHYYGVFWKGARSIYAPYCTWTLKHSTDLRKEVLEYGDRFVLSNVNWPSFAFGLDTTSSWVVAVYEYENEVEDRIVWQLKKM